MQGTFMSTTQLPLGALASSVNVNPVGSQEACYVLFNVDKSEGKPYRDSM